MVRRGKGRWTREHRKALGATLAILLVAPSAAGMEEAELEPARRSRVRDRSGVINASAHGILNVHTSGPPQAASGQRVRLGSAETTITLPSSWTAFFYALGARGAGGTVKSLDVDLGGESVKHRGAQLVAGGVLYTTSVGSGNRLEIAVRSFGYFSTSPIANSSTRLRPGRSASMSARAFTENGAGSYTSTGGGIVFTLNGYESGGGRGAGRGPDRVHRAQPTRRAAKAPPAGSGREGARRRPRRRPRRRRSRRLRRTRTRATGEGAPASGPRGERPGRRARRPERRTRYDGETARRDGRER